MALTITQIGAVDGVTFSAKLKKYVDGEYAATYYVLDGTQTGVGPFCFVVEPTTSFETNPSTWAAYYRDWLDRLFG